MNKWRIWQKAVMDRWFYNYYLFILG